MLLRHYLKTLILFILNIFCLILPKKRAAILLYHSIDKNNVFLTVDPEDFRKQMKYLFENGYNVIKLSDLVELILSKKEIRPKTVVLTFDDGFLSHYRNVLPTLEKYNFQATFFISTKKLGGEINNSQNIPQPTMNWDELEEINKSSLIDVEPHGVTHSELDGLEDEGVRKEVGELKRRIEGKLNKRCLFFAYPRGKYNDKVVEVVREEFRAAVTTDTGLVKVGDDLFKLKRNTVDSSCNNRVQFEARLNQSIAIFNKIFQRNEY
jgi:peptidoglycan/xylan/chitin deacetylase (PgdA/CDA1 family)